MKHDRNAFKAGLFIIVSVALALGIIIAIKGTGNLAEPRETRLVAFKLSDDVGGLRVGDDVRVGGFRVGSIDSIEPAALDSADPKVLVRITLPAKFKLHAGARVGVQTTLTGTSVLNVDSLGTGPLLASSEAIPGKPDPKTVLFAGLGEAVPRVTVAVDSATALVRHVNEKVDPLSGRIMAVTDKAEGVMDSVNGVVKPAGPDIRATLANINKITGDLKDKLPGMIDKVDTTIDNARSALQEVQVTAANARDISTTAREVISGNRGKLESIIGSVKSTGDNLKAASVEIRHSPWRLLYQPKTSELSNLNLFDAARQFADGANELNDAAQALRDASKDQNTDARQMQQLINRLETSFTNFHEVEQKLWNDVKE